MTREEFISCFQIEEAPLQRLVNDLMAQPDTPNNRNMLHKALRGIYSAFMKTVVLALDSQSKVTGDSELKIHFKILMKTEPQYASMYERACHMVYKHTRGARQIRPYEDSEEFSNAATVAKPPRISREQFLAPYSSDEDGYIKLISDLMALPATEENYTLLEDCVSGKFSDLHSDTLPGMELIGMLNNAASSDPSYKQLVSNAISGVYDHLYSPLKNGNPQNNYTVKELAADITDWIKRDQDRVDHAEMEDGPKPGFF